MSENKKTEWAKRVLKAVTAIACIALFVYHFYGVFADYTNGETIVATKFVQLDSMVLPTFAFCLQVGYRDANAPLPLTVTDYKNVTTDPWDYVLNISASLTDYSHHIDYASHPELWRVREIYTIYQGRCLTVRSKVKVCTYVIFIALADYKLTGTFLTD